MKIPTTMVKKTKEWIKENRFEAFFLILVLLTAAFMRLYRIDEYMTFLGDEGRDVIIVRRLLVNFDPILIGPGTSIGNMYLGPIYYYLMAPFLLLANFSPVGPAIFIALLGVLTCAFVWFIAREWFGKIAAGVAILLYSISPVVINYSRSSWNPNIMPFFALLTVYSIWRVWQYSEFKWLVISLVSFAFTLQSHYLGLLLGPVLVFFWLLTFLKIRKQKDGWRVKKGGFLKHTMLGSILFTVLMSPLVIFDARHGWQNFSAIRTFFLERQTTISARPWSAFPKLLPLVQKISTRLLAGTNETLGRWSTAVFGAGVLWTVSRFISLGVKDKKNAAFFVLFVWLGCAFLGLGVYKQEIYDHYYGFFFPAPFLFLGGVFQTFIEKRRFSLIHVFLAVFVVALVAANLTVNPLKYPPNRQMQRAESVAEKIRTEAKNEKFNLAVIAERNYEDGYQYFLEKWKVSVFDIDPLKLEETLANNLFVVCELPHDKCNPVNNPKAEIANFGWSEVSGEWQVSGVMLYKLVHTE